ncbi:Carbohydrate sulfotransferase 15 [Branchiostoma belcheri]|nr:Carbohydrate sulfotransferase 15 [Branchiostoma belcheri]
MWDNRHWRREFWDTPNNEPPILVANLIRAARLRLGLYEVYLRDWFSIFPRDQILVQRLEDRSKDLKVTIAEVFKFLQLETVSNKAKNATIFGSQKGKSRKPEYVSMGPMLPKTRQVLDRFYRPAKSQVPERSTRRPNKNKANITIPYVQGVSEKLRRIFQNFNIATNFKPHSTLRQRLVHPKDRPRKGTKANVIYRLKCEEPNCNNTYIGETSRPLKVRYKEHCRPSANGYSSAIFHHQQHNQGHSFKRESTDVLDRETRWWERGVKEAIYERMYNPTLNREGGLRVDLSGT